MNAKLESILQKGTDLVSPKLTTSNLEKTEELKLKSKSEATELKGNIIDTKKFIEDLAKNQDGTIDNTKVSTFNTNISKLTKLGYPDYNIFSKALNDKLLKDKETIQKQNKGIKDKKIESELKSKYTAKLQELSSRSLEEEETMESFFGSQVNITYEKLTGARMQGSYQEVVQNTTAYKIETDENKEESEEKPTPAEMKKVSKEVIKFLNSESLSQEERRQIRLLIKTVAGIDRKTEIQENIETIILQFFEHNVNVLPSLTKEDRINLDSSKIKGIDITTEKGKEIYNNMKKLKISELSSKRLQKLGLLYYQTRFQKNQTLRRLFDFIQQEKGIKKSSLDDSIAKAKETEKYVKQEARKLKKDSYEIGNKLKYKPEDLAKVKAYLKTIKPEEIAQNKTIIKAITDFDLNGSVTQKDVGTKSGPQIQEIIKGFKDGEEKALENIIALANKILSKSEITEKITKENLLSDPAYLILIQNTLKNPSFDASDIIRFGDKTVENIYNISENSDKTIESQTRKIENELKRFGIPVEDGLKDIVSTTILKSYSNYGYGLGIPLNEFIKGLSLNLGTTTLPSGTESFGINLGRNGKKSLGKGREATGGLSAGTSIAFIPMASVQGGFIKTFDNKKQSTSLDVRSTKKFQLSAHATILPGNFGYGGSMGIERNKRESAKEQAPKLKTSLQSFFSKILEPAEGSNIFTFNKTDLEKRLEENLKESFKNSKKDSITKAINNISLILAQYDGLSKDKIPEAATKISESYGDARVNQSARDMNNKRYVAGGGLSITFFEGIIPIVGIMNFQKHKVTSSNDINPDIIKSKEFSDKGNEKFKDGIEKLIEQINKNTGSEIKLEGELITIPKSTRTEKNVEIRINENMKGLVKTDKDGNLILHKNTPVRFFDTYLSDRGRKVLNIGEFSSNEGDKKLDIKTPEVQKDFVTEGEISKEKLPVKIMPDTENVNQILNNLKNQIAKDDKENTILKDIKAEVAGSTIIFKNADIEIGKLENITNQSKIILNKKTDGSLNFEKIEDKDQKRLTIKYIEKTESKTVENYEEEIKFDDTETNEIIKTIYEEGRQITDNLFHNIIHSQSGKSIDADYKGFNENIKKGDYTKAKENLLSLLGKIKKNSFAKTKENLTKITDEGQLIKVLSAFNVFFSRVANVRIDNKGNYTYRYGEKAVNGIKLIEESERRITTSKDRSFEKELGAYRPNKETITKDNVKQLFDTIRDRRKNIDFTKRTQTENTISFNHGNPQDFFKLQVNPEIIGDFRIGLDSLKDSKNDKFIEDLKSAYINQLISTETKLINNTMKKLGVKNELSLDQLRDFFTKKEIIIDDKKYVLSYEQNFGYNPECNNFVRLLENIKIKTSKVEEQKTEKKYEASLEGNGLAVNYSETSSQVEMKTNRFNVAVAGILKPNTPPPTKPDTIIDEDEIDIPDPTDPDPDGPGNPNPTDPDPSKNNPNPTDPDPSKNNPNNGNTNNPNTGGTGNSGSQTGGRG